MMPDFQERIDFIIKLFSKPFPPMFPEDTSTTVVEFDVCPSCGCAHYTDVPCSVFVRPEGL
jgi:hypothetical protein